MSIFVQEGKPENPEKNPRSKLRTNNSLNPDMTQGQNQSWPHWLEASALILVPSLLTNTAIMLACQNFLALEASKFTQYDSVFA